MNNTKNKKKDLLAINSYAFSIRIINLVESFPNTRVYWVLGDQLLRSGTSIGANIIEARASHSKKDFIKFFQIALKSAHEAVYWLKLLKDTKKANVRSLETLLGKCEELCRLLSASLITLKNNF